MLTVERAPRHALAYQRVGIIHGWKGSSATHWQTWLARRCRTLGAETHYPKLPGRFGVPRLPDWLEAIERTMPIIGTATALVGHSLGCATLLQMVQTDRVDRVGLLVLVSPTSPGRVFGGIRHFFDNVDLNRIRAKCDQVEMFTADNDMWVNLEQARGWASDLRAGFRLIRGGGHLNVASGHHTFPEILRVLKGSEQ